jgi:hypothetical protein
MSRGAPLHLVVPNQENATSCVSIRESDTYAVAPGIASPRLFHECSTTFPLVLDKLSTGLSTGQSSVIPEQIRRFSTRFATCFRVINQHHHANLFHQLFRARGSRLGRNGKGEKEAESTFCGKGGELPPVGVRRASAHTMWHVEQFTCGRASSRRLRRLRRTSRLPLSSALRRPQFPVSAQMWRRAGALRPSG